MGASVSQCEPCSTLKKDRNAASWCMDCEESLCSYCVSSHKSFKGLKNHHIVDIKFRDSYSMLNLKCEKHSKEPEYYCSQHEEICCRDCLAEQHKACTNTMSLESASEGVQESCSLLDCLDRLEHISKTHQRIADDREKVATEVIKKGEDIKQKYLIIRDQFISKINLLEKKYCEDVNDKVDIVTAQLRSQKLDAIRCKEKNDIQLKEIRFINDHGSNKQAFLMVLQMNKFLQESENELQIKMSELKNKNLTYKIKDQTEAFNPFGKIAVEESSCNIAYNHPKAQQAQRPV
ncbi:unnamed protein product [Mytilus coruscus]|uniref:B box-type domain-containing protein n=1 Tax=Mytilus coruscus TaxID=42192 RepID=A0A6J8BJP9_MYTCO|nr:unnamed protein product [Mytilus coruscus]